VRRTGRRFGLTRTPLNPNPTAGLWAVAMEAEATEAVACSCSGSAYDCSHSACDRVALVYTLKRRADTASLVSVRCVSTCA